jgi:hypothetical protein
LDATFDRFGLPPEVLAFEESLQVVEVGPVFVGSLLGQRFVIFGKVAKFEIVDVGQPERRGRGSVHQEVW